MGLICQIDHPDSIAVSFARAVSHPSLPPPTQSTNETFCAGLSTVWETVARGSPPLSSTLHAILEMFPRNTRKGSTVWPMLIFVGVGNTVTSQVTLKERSFALRWEFKILEIFVEMWEPNRCQAPTAWTSTGLSIDSDLLGVKAEKALMPSNLAFFDPVSGAPILRFRPPRGSIYTD